LALNAERQELDDLVREQDTARRHGIVQPLEPRLSPEERATADARRQEIAATLEKHRAARTAADQAQRFRDRLDAIDTDSGLFELAREIAPEVERAPPAATPSVSRLSHLLSSSPSNHHGQDHRHGPERLDRVEPASDRIPTGHALVPSDPAARVNSPGSVL
jgi:hypothetical protein